MSRERLRVFYWTTNESPARGYCKRGKSCFDLYWRSVLRKVQEVTYSCVALRRHHQCHQTRGWVPCSREDTDIYWKVFRRKQHEEVKKPEKRLKELNLSSATRRKLLCNLACCQHVIVVIKVPDFHGSLIYWFANLPGWFRLDVEKTSCYHHETVARPPREVRKPPSLGDVTDKIDDALSGHSPRSVVAHCFWFIDPHVCALQGEE